MPRVPSNSMIRELDLSNPSEIIEILGELAENNIEEIALTLEPCTLEISLGGRTHTVVYSEPSLVIPPAEIYIHIQGFKTVSKPAWCEYITLRTDLLLDLLGVYSRRENRAIGSIRVVFHNDLVECDNPLIPETLLLKYTWRKHIMDIDYSALDEFLRGEQVTGRWPLLVCLDGEINSLAWAMREDDKWVLNIHGFNEDLSPYVLRVYLDFVLYVITSRESSTISHRD